jgi:predicted nucleotide-binding protein (sugar kinase/HSP70/actin superfamily)
MGYKTVLLHEIGTRAIRKGLDYVDDTMCGPAHYSAGSIIDYMENNPDVKGKEDLHAVLLTQTCGPCRSVDYIGLTRKGLTDAGFPNTAVVPLSFVPGQGEKGSGFKMTPPMLTKLIRATILADTLMQCHNATKPYEVTPGSADELYNSRLADIKEKIGQFGGLGFTRQKGWRLYEEAIGEIVDKFDSLPRIDSGPKEKVLLEGEILAKYHPGYNHGIVDQITEQGYEAVVPPMLSFLEYASSGSTLRKETLGTNSFVVWATKLGVDAMERMRQPAREALDQSRHFEAPPNIWTLSGYATGISTSYSAGEGWLQSAEVAHAHEKESVNKAVFVQPFGCLAGHIVAEGVIRPLEDRYPGLKIEKLDYAPDDDGTHQRNRLLGFLGGK